MPLRRRMAVATALAVGAAVLLVAVVAYVVVRGELQSQIDRQLAEQARLVQRAGGRLRPELAGRLRGLGVPPPGFPAPPARRGGSAEYVQFVRTNIEVLAENRLDGAERARLVADVQAQAEELSALVADLIELARGDQPNPAHEDVRLDALVAEAVERARRHAPGVTFETELEPAVVDGVPDRLARAVNNLLDNAARHGSSVFASSDPSGIRVRDDGGGIAPEDLPHIFDRFYRGADARGRPGTGLGLAIVRQVAEQHGGSVSAANVDGGAEFALSLPATNVNTRI